jgi:hypothetical protein
MRTGNLPDAENLFSPPPRIAKAAAASYAAHASEKTIVSEPDIRMKVLEAHGRGVQVREISRQLHISADQVMLIIKMSGR